MTRRAWTLAALADAALPGLHPVGVAEVVDHVGEQFQVGFVDDTLGRRWVVRVPGDAVAAAQQDGSVALMELLAERVPFAVPQPAGFAPLRDGRRAMVYPVLPGRPLAFDGLPPDRGFTSTLGRALAALHNVDRALFDEAGVPGYDAEDCRRRRQADVDRGAQTGLVPTGLLSRWERMLDDVAWWRFAPTPVHGRLDDGHVLAEFDGEDSSTGRITGITSWENAHIGDPAQDLAALVSRAGRLAVAAVLEAYAGERTQPPDPHLERRAGLLGELSCLTDLLTARRLGDRRHVAHATQVLRDLDEQVNDGRGGNRSGTSIDQLPVDFDPAPTDGAWYRAGGTSVAADNEAIVVYSSEDDDAPSAPTRAERRAGQEGDHDAAVQGDEGAATRDGVASRDGAPAPDGDPAPEGAVADDQAAPTELPERPAVTFDEPEDLPGSIAPSGEPASVAPDPGKGALNQIPHQVDSPAEGHPNPDDDRVQIVSDGPAPPTRPLNVVVDPAPSETTTVLPRIRRDEPLDRP